MKNSFWGRWFLHQLNLHEYGKKSIPYRRRKQRKWTWHPGGTVLLAWLSPPMETWSTAWTGQWLSPGPTGIWTAATVSSRISLLPILTPSNLFLYVAPELSSWKHKSVYPWYLLWLIQGLLVVSLKGLRPVSLTYRVPLRPWLPWSSLTVFPTDPAWSRGKASFRDNATIRPICPCMSLVCSHMPCYKMDMIPSWLPLRHCEKPHSPEAFWSLYTVATVSMPLSRITWI